MALIVELDVGDGRLLEAGDGSPERGRAEGCQIGM